MEPSRDIAYVSVNTNGCNNASMRDAYGYSQDGTTELGSKENTCTSQISFDGSTCMSNSPCQSKADFKVPSRFVSPASGKFQHSSSGKYEISPIRKAKNSPAVKSQQILAGKYQLSPIGKAQQSPVGNNEPNILLGTLESSDSRSNLCIASKLYHSPAPGSYQSPAAGAYNSSIHQTFSSPAFLANQRSPNDNNQRTPKSQGCYSDSTVFKTPEGTPRSNRSITFGQGESPASTGRTCSNPSFSPLEASPRIIVKFQDIHGNRLQKASVATSFVAPESPSDVMLHNITNTLIRKPDIKPCRSTIRRMDFQDDQNVPDVRELIVRKTQMKRLSEDGESPECEPKRSKTSLFPDGEIYRNTPTRKALAPGFSSTQHILNAELSPNHTPLLRMQDLADKNSAKEDIDQVMTSDDISPMSTVENTSDHCAPIVFPPIRTFSLSDLDRMSVYPDASMPYCSQPNQVPYYQYPNTNYTQCGDILRSPAQSPRFDLIQHQTPQSSNQAVGSEPLWRVANAQESYMPPLSSSTPVAMPSYAGKDDAAPSWYTEAAWQATPNYQQRDANNNSEAQNRRLPMMNESSPTWPAAGYSWTTAYGQAHSGPEMNKSYLGPGNQPGYAQNSLYQTSADRPLFSEQAGISGHYGFTYCNPALANTHPYGCQNRTNPWTYGMDNARNLPTINTFSPYDIASNQKINALSPQVPLQSLLLQRVPEKLDSDPNAFHGQQHMQKQYLDTITGRPITEGEDMSKGSSNSISVVYMGQSLAKNGQKLAMMMSAKKPPAYAMLDQNAGGSWSNIDSSVLPHNMSPFMSISPSVIGHITSPRAVPGGYCKSTDMASHSEQQNNTAVHYSAATNVLSHAQNTQQQMPEPSLMSLVQPLMPTQLQQPVIQGLQTVQHSTSDVQLHNYACTSVNNDIPDKNNQSKTFDSGYKSFFSTTLSSDSHDAASQEMSSSQSTSLNTPTSPYEKSAFQPISPADSPRSNDLPTPIIPKVQQAVLSTADITPMKGTADTQVGNPLSSSIDRAKITNNSNTKTQQSSIVVSHAQPTGKDTQPLYIPVTSVGTTVQLTYQPTQIAGTNQPILDPKTLMYAAQGAVNIPGIPLYPIVLGSQANSGLNHLYQPVLTSSQPLLANTVPAVVPTANLLPVLQSFSAGQPMTATTHTTGTLQQSISYTQVVHPGKTPVAKDGSLMKDRQIISTTSQDTGLVSSTTPGFQAEVNCPKSRFFSLLGLNIGTYMYSEPDTKKRLSRVQFQFNMGKLTYELPVEVQQVEAGMIVRKNWHICLVDVYFSTVIGLSHTKTELILEVTSPPIIRNKGTMHPTPGERLVDPTGGQMSICPYQKLLLRADVPKKIVDLLSMADRRFVGLAKRQLLMDEDKVIKRLTYVPPPQLAHEHREAEKTSSSRLHSCSCSMGCLFSRCKCATAEQQCSNKCRCTKILKNCVNPVNQMIKHSISMDIAKKDNCLMANIFRIRNLGSYLEREMTFPCCGIVQPLDGMVPGLVTCPQPGCIHTFKYSWCLEKLMDTADSPRNHCDICCTCTEPSAIHCTNCNSCFTPTEDVPECPCQVMHMLDDHKRRIQQNIKNQKAKILAEEDVSVTKLPVDQTSTKTLTSVTNKTAMMSSVNVNNSPVMMEVQSEAQRTCLINMKHVNEENVVISERPDSETESDTEVHTGLYMPAYPVLDGTVHQQLEMSPSQSQTQSLVSHRNRIVPKGVCTEPMTPVRLLHSHYMEKQKKDDNHSCSTKTKKDFDKAPSIVQYNDAKPEQINPMEDRNEHNISRSASATSCLPMVTDNIMCPPWFKGGNCLWNPLRSPSTYTTANSKDIVESTFINPTIEQSAAIIQDIYSCEQQQSGFIHRTPMLTDAMKTPPQGSTDTPEECSLSIHNSGKEISRLEKSFSTSLNFFSTLSPPSFHDSSRNMTLMHSMNPLESNFGHCGDLMMPSYMETPNSTAESDSQDIIIQDSNVNGAELATRTPDRSSVMDVDTTALMPTLNTPNTSKEQEKPLNLSNAKCIHSTVQDSSSNNHEFTSNSLLCTPKSSYSNRMPLPLTHYLQSGQHTLELGSNHEQMHTKSTMELNQIYSQEIPCNSISNSKVDLGNEDNSAHISLVYQVVDDIQAAWPPNNTDTSCVLGEPLKTSSPFSTQQT